MRITNGIPVQDRSAATALYWEAFGAKLGRVMGPTHKAQAFVTRVLDPTHAICAHDTDGTLLGVAGFKTVDGALVGGDFTDMAAVYGQFGALWRGLLLNLLERDTENHRFLMDGIFVASQARGQGVGSALLDAVTAEAATRGFAEVRLDVVDTNPRARALYERQGFRAVRTHRMGPLRMVFGFGSATVMVRSVS